MNSRNRPRKPPSFIYFIVILRFPLLCKEYMEQQNIDYSTDLPAHAEMLKGFFSILFAPDEKLLMVPGLNEEQFNALGADLGDWPKEIGGRKTTYYDKELRCIQPRRYLNPFSRSPASSSTRNLAALHEINRQGYDIYFAINPMTCRRRCQKTVTMAKHVLIESDENDIDAQFRFLREHEANIVSAVHSGGKSLHCLVRISPPRPHPGVVGAWTAFHLPKGATKATWAEYRQMGDYWIAEAQGHGMEIDTAAAHDHSRISRVPGFLHSKTGRRAEVVRMNPSASWDWKDSMRSSILSIYENQNDDDSFSILKPKTKSFNEHGETYKDLEETREKIDPATKHVVRAPRKHGRSQSPKGSFLDLLDNFETLRQNGLPGRHIRRSMHRALFETARVFKWSETRMAEEWARVIQRNPAATVETVESAVEDMLRAFKSTDGIGIYLPNLTRLPEMNEDNMGTLRDRLDGLGCKETGKALRIIAKVIFPLLKASPGKCAMGAVRIKSVALRNAANSRERYRGHKAVWQWMQSSNIVKCTKFKYAPGKASRLYLINIPIILWLLGFTTGDLDWNKAMKHWWPELSRMRVVNDVTRDFKAVGFDSVVSRLFENVPL